MVAETAKTSTSSLQSASPFSRLGDGIFYWGTLFFATSVMIITLMLAVRLWLGAWPAIQASGWHFLTTSKWDPVHNVYGAWPFIYGTLVSSFLALLIAVPIGVGTAIFVSELAPKWMRTPISFMVELLAAVPSVVYGLWGVFVMLPFLRPIQAWLAEHFGYLPFFQGAAYGYSMMAGALILVIMVLPFITAVSRDVISAVPPTQREAAYGLGATQWEVIKGPVLRYARSGIMGAVILGLARALGETMAITMVIGNGDEVSASLLAIGNTLASKLALEFNEASGSQLPALLYVSLVLFVITIIVNVIARLMIWNMTRNVQGAAAE